MAINDLVSRLILEDQFSQAFDAYLQKLNESESKTGKTINTLRQFAGVGAVIGGSLAVAGAAVDALAQQAVEAEKANTNLAIAVTAASREFGAGVGSVESWKATIAGLQDELQIFSERDLTNASTRLVDMTKRLGLNEAQMAEVLRRTADLSAGKVELVDGLERVTAGLRGEAEAAEMLGLSLNETTIKAYAESQGLVWSKLNDTEKAQLRYAVLLQQTNELQGRAAAYAETAAGKQDALNAKYTEATTALGQQLLPLQQGYVELLSKMAGSTSESGGIITTVFAAIAASYVAFGATAKIVIEGEIERIKSYVSILGAAAIAIRNGQNPFAAVMEQINKGNAAGAQSTTAIVNYGNTWKSAFDQIKAGYEELGQGSDEFVDKTAAATEAVTGLGTAAQAAAQEAGKAYADAADKIAQSADRYRDRLAQAEFDNAQRMVEVQRDAARTIQQAAADAAAARLESAQKLAEGIAEIERRIGETQAEANRDRAEAKREMAADIAGIERDLAAEQADAQRKLNQDLAALRQDRQEAERDYARAVADIDRELSEDQEDLAYKLAQDKAKIVTDSQAEQAQIQQDYADKRVKTEQDYQDAVARINSDYERDYAEADPFKRKMLAYNREQQLAALEQQKTDELAALTEQEKAALTAAQTKADAEIAIREQQAAREAEILAREAAEARANQQEKLNDTLAELAQRKALLEENYRYEQQQRAADAALAIQQAREEAAQEIAEINRREQAEIEEQTRARQRLTDQHAEELTKIDAQEAAKKARAAQSIADEQQRQADRLASMRFAQAQELADLQASLLQIERARRESYTRQIQDYQNFQQQIAAGQFNGGNGPTVSAGNGGSTSNNVVVNNYGVSGGYAGAVQTGRSVVDALNGY